MKIPIRVLEEINVIYLTDMNEKTIYHTAHSLRKYNDDKRDIDIVWIDKNGINTPYLVTVVNNE